MSTQLQLFPYQELGVSWMSVRPRVILGDDMGLGKTIEFLEYCHRQGAKRVLVVATNTMKFGWRDELARFWPQYTSIVIDAATMTPDQRLKAIKDKSFNFVMINYDMFRRLAPELAKCKFDIAGFDEAHHLSNRDSITRKQAAKFCTSVQRLVLITGTPVQNHASEYWSLLNLLDRKRWSSYWRYVGDYCRVFNNGFGVEIEDFADETDPRNVALVKATKPYILRRIKKDVRPDMPDKIIKQVWVRLTPADRRMYRDMDKRMLVQFSDGETVGASMAIAQHTRLRQICVDPNLMRASLPPGVMLTGAKAEAIKDLVDSFRDAKFLVYSQWVEALKLVHPLLTSLGVKSLLLTGDTPPEQRQTLQAMLNDPKSGLQALLISTGAGGEGLTLTGASHGIFLDKHWNPKRNEQAQDRMHRHGQLETVNIYEILVENTIEEFIEVLLKHKIDVSNAIVRANKSLLGFLRTGDPELLKGLQGFSDGV